MKSFIFLLLILFATSCAEQEEEPSNFSKILHSSWSPNGKWKLTLTEHGYDSTDCYTQVIIDFGSTGSGVYSTNGRNLGIKTYWKDNHTIVIETKKEYDAPQKWSQVQSFRNIVKVEYIEN